jgi:hypothetical protein
MIGEGRAAHWVGELSYSYSVDGNYFSGFYHSPASGEDRATRWVQGWKDRRVVVHYAPENPSQSVLIVEEQNQPSGAITTEVGLR